jgi:hypothetical protein
MDTMQAASVSLAYPRPTAAKRTSTPPPKAKLAEEKKVQEAESDDDDASSTQSEEEVAPEYTGKLILGLHPQAFTAAIAIPVVVLALCAVTSGPARPYLAVAVKSVAATWKTISSPLERFLVNYSEILVGAAALLGLSPLIVTLAVTCFRATMDLRHAPMWQKASLATLVVSALATLSIFRSRTLWVLAMMKKTWDCISDPLEHFLEKNADYMVAGAAILSLSPFVIVFAKLVFDTLWSCRVKPVAESGAADEKPEKPKQAK